MKLKSLTLNGTTYDSFPDGDAVKITQLQDAINTALAQAKASGEFDGKDGSDYVLTDADKQEIAEQAAELVDAQPKTLVVTLTENDDGVFIASHSSAEIEAHINAGGDTNVLYDNFLYRNDGGNDNEWYYVYTRVDIDFVENEFVVIRDDKTAEFFSDIYEPNNENVVKTVNGKAPDENGNVEITIPGTGASSWNDLTDKPFGEAVNVDLFAVAELMESVSDPLGDDRYGVLCVFDTTPEICSIEAGKEYTVTLNGHTYTEIAKHFSGEEGSPGIFYIGDLEATLNEDWANVRYLFAFVQNYVNGEITDQYLVWAAHTGTETELTECVISQGVTKLDEKYIPDTIARVSDVKRMIEEAIGSILDASEVAY